MHLLDVLEHLKFLDEDILRGIYNSNFLEKQQAYLQIKIALNAQSANVVISSGRGGSLGAGPEPEVQTNLFKILCAIINIKPNQRGSNRLPDEVLQRQLSRIGQPSLTFEENVVQQVLVVKNLISRPAYTMTEEQISHIHKKFKDLANYRTYRSVQGSLGSPRQ